MASSVPPGKYSGGNPCGPHLFADLPQDGRLEQHGLEEGPYHTALLPRLQLTQLLNQDSIACGARGMSSETSPAPPPHGHGAPWPWGPGLHEEGENVKCKDPLDLKDHLAPGGQRDSECACALDAKRPHKRGRHAEKAT